jgi:imidazolonepropionase-like amidohydrolase
VLIEGKKIVAVGPNLHAGGATEIDARGRIVMPGFIDSTIINSRRRCAASSPRAF